MAREKNARSSNAVADLPKNHHNQPQDFLPNRGPIVSAVGAPLPPWIGNTIDIPPQASVQPVAHTTDMETIQARQQGQEALENIIIQLIDAVMALA